MNMDFEQLLKQEVQKAARQDYEEITAKAQDYPYKFSKELSFSIIASSFHISII